MKNLNKYTGLSILLFTLIYVVGCGPTGPTTTAPKGWLPSVSTAQHESYGGWVTIKSHTRDSESEVHGELIAVDPSQIFILTEQGFTHISIDRITHVKLTTIRLAKNFTLTTNNIDVNKRRQMMYPVKPLEEFRAYARFPQGLPEGIDMQSFNPKKKRSTLPQPKGLSP